MCRSKFLQNAAAGGPLPFFRPDLLLFLTAVMRRGRLRLLGFRRNGEPQRAADISCSHRRGDCVGELLASDKSGKGTVQHQFALSRALPCYLGAPALLNFA
jgi:hypothetical protein